MEEQVIYPMKDKCSIPGCKEKATRWYPLLPGGPGFCHKHKDRAIEYGADLSGPDDFEEPWIQGSLANL